MEESDRKDFGVIMATCDAIYGWKNIELLIQAFWVVLKPYPLPAIQAAFFHHMKTSPRAPTPADIVRIANGGTAEDHAQMAWPKALSLLDRYMANLKTLVPDGAAVMAARELASYFNKDDYKYNFNSFKSYYVKYYNQGYRNVPMVFEGRRDYDQQLGKFHPQEKIIYNDLWGPEDVHRHKKELRDFLPDCPLLKAPEGREDKQISHNQGLER